jgi:hypothetical protein
MRACLRLLLFAAAILAAASAFAAESACEGLDVTIPAGTIGSGTATFTAGDEITIAARDAPEFSGGTLGDEPVTALPYDFSVEKEGPVAWRLPVAGKQGAVTMSCLPAGKRASAGTVIAAASGIGGVLLVVIVVAGLLRQAVISGGIGLLVASIAAALRPLPAVLATGHPVLDQFVALLALGIGGGLAAWAVLLGVVNVRSGIEVFNWRARAEEARGELTPSRWPIAADKALASGDIVRRWFVTVSAATGGLVASLGGLEKFWHALGNALSPGNIIFTFVGATAAVVLFGPLHDYVLEAGAGHRDKGNAFAELLETLTPQRIVRFLFAALIAFLIVVSGECVTEAARNSTVDAVILIATAGLMPGVVTHFWSAALQYDAPSVEEQATMPALVAGMIFSFPAGVALSIALVASEFFNSDGTFVRDSNVPAMGIFLGIPLFALIFMFLLSIVNFAVFAFAGGRILDRGRSGGVGLFLLLAVAMAALLVVVWIVLQTVAGLILAGRLIPDIDRNQILQQALIGVGWAAGLWLSGFPQLMQRRGGEAKAGVHG